MAAKRFMSSTTFILGLLYLFLLCVHAEAQQLATFVSGVGNDTTACTRALPCQSLQRAILQTTNGGKVYVLDALVEVRTFVPLSIPQSVSIIGAGARASIEGNININPEAGGRVLLKGLDIRALGGSGLSIQGEGLTVIVDDCTILDGSTGIGFNPTGTANSNLTVRNSIIARNGSGAGISIQPQSTGKALVVIENVNINNNSYGVRAFDNSTVTIRNSIISENVFTGVRSEAAVAGQVAVFIEHSQVSHNGGHGVFASGTTAVLLISDVTITNNAGSGVYYTSGGTVLSYRNNAINGPTMQPTTAMLN